MLRDVPIAQAALSNGLGIKLLRGFEGWSFWVVFFLYNFDFSGFFSTNDECTRSNSLHLSVQYSITDKCFFFAHRQSGLDVSRVCTYGCTRALAEPVLYSKIHILGIRNVHFYQFRSAAFWVYFYDRQVCEMWCDRLTIFQVRFCLWSSAQDYELYANSFVILMLVYLNMR